MAFVDLGDIQPAHGVIRAQFIVDTEHSERFVKQLLLASNKLNEKLAASSKTKSWGQRLATLLSGGYRDLEVITGKAVNTIWREHQQGIRGQQLEPKPTFRELHPTMDFDFLQEPNLTSIKTKRDVESLINTVVESAQMFVEEKAMNNLNHKVDLVINATDVARNASAKITKALESITDALDDIKVDDDMEHTAIIAGTMTDLAFRHQIITGRLAVGVTKLRKRELSPQAIPIYKMEQAIMEVHRIAQKQDPNLIFPSLHVLEAYTLKSHIQERNGTIKVMVDFPLAKAGEHKFVMLRFIPGPIWKNFPGDPVLPSPDESILVTDGFSASLMTEEMAKRVCVQLGNRTICETTVKYKNMEDTCLGALYKGKVGRALKHCPLRQPQAEPRVMAIGSNQFLFTSIFNMSVSIFCRSVGNRLHATTTTHHVIGSKVMTIGDGCYLDSDTIYVEPEKVQSLQVVRIYIPEFKDLDSGDLSWEQDDYILKKVAIASTNIAGALKLNQRSHEILERARKANIPADYSFLLGIVNDTLIAPVVTSAESGLTFAEDVISSASDAVGIFTHPTGLIAAVAGLLGIFLLIAGGFLVVKMGMCSYRDPDSKCKKRCDSLRNELEDTMEDMAKEAMEEAKLYAKKASYEAYKMMKSQCTCRDGRLPALT